MDNSQPSEERAARQWFIVGCRQEYEGEARANLLRIAAIGVFYLVELLNYYGLNLGFMEIPQTVDAPFHRIITGLALAWIVTAMAVHLALTQHYFPAALKYLSTAFDILFLTVVLGVADGPRSPLLVGYFLVIVLATLRFNLPLVRFATLGAMIAYLGLLGYFKWISSRDLNVPRYHEILFLLGLGTTGVILGQILRRVKEIAEDYARRMGPPKSEGEA
jgi:hypothetical protein